jgi:hypothetical protein
MLNSFASKKENRLLITNRISMVSVVLVNVGSISEALESKPLDLEVFDSKRYNPNLTVWIPINIPFEV